MNSKPLKEDRRDDRYQIILVGLCSVGGGARSTAEITDLSTHGCKIRTSPTLLEVNAVVRIKLGNRDPLQGQVRWHKADVGGVEWDSPLYPAILDHIYGMHDASRDMSPDVPILGELERRGSLRRII